MAAQNLINQYFRFTSIKSKAFEQKCEASNETV